MPVSLNYGLALAQVKRQMRRATPPTFARYARWPKIKRDTIFLLLLLPLPLSVECGMWNAWNGPDPSGTSEMQRPENSDVQHENALFAFNWKFFTWIVIAMNTATATATVLTLALSLLLLLFLLLLFLYMYVYIFGTLSFGFVLVFGCEISVFFFYARLHWKRFWGILAFCVSIVAGEKCAGSIDYRFIRKHRLLFQKRGWDIR